MVPDKLVHSMVILSQKDDISRMRANPSDEVETNQSEVCVRFMKVTLLDVVREYDGYFPGFVGCSTFYYVRSPCVKIV
jgi:hypothetical protein